VDALALGVAGIGKDLFQLPADHLVPVRTT